MRSPLSVDLDSAALNALKACVSCNLVDMHPNEDVDECVLTLSFTSLIFSNGILTPDQYKPNPVRLLLLDLSFCKCAAMKNFLVYAHLLCEPH